MEKYHKKKRSGKVVLRIGFIFELCLYATIVISWRDHHVIVGGTRLHLRLLHPCALEIVGGCTQWLHWSGIQQDNYNTCAGSVNGTDRSGLCCQMATRNVSSRPHDYKGRLCYLMLKTLSLGFSTSGSQCSDRVGFGLCEEGWCTDGEKCRSICLRYNESHRSEGQLHPEEQSWLPSSFDVRWTTRGLEVGSIASLEQGQSDPEALVRGQSESGLMISWSTT